LTENLTQKLGIESVKASRRLEFIVDTIGRSKAKGVHMFQRVLMVALVAGLSAAVPAAQTSTTKEGAKKVGEAGKEVGKVVGEGTKAAGEGTKEVAKETGELAKDAGKASGKAGKEVGKETAAAAKEAGKATTSATKKVTGAVTGSPVEATCNDGTTQKGKTKEAACTDHGGVKAAAAK